MTPAEYFKEYTVSFFFTISFLSQALQKKQEDLKQQREAEEENRRKEEEEKARIKKLEEEERARLAAEEAAKNPQASAGASPKQETETAKTVENGENGTELEEMETNAPARAQTEPVKTEVAAQVAQNPLAAMNQLVGNVEKLAEPSHPEQQQVTVVKTEPEGVKVGEAASEQVSDKPTEEPSTPVVKEETPSAPDIKTEEPSSAEAMETDQVPATEPPAPTES